MLAICPVASMELSTLLKCRLMVVCQNFQATRLEQLMVLATVMPSVLMISSISMVKPTPLTGTPVIMMPMLVWDIMEHVVKKWISGRLILKLVLILFILVILMDLRGVKVQSVEIMILVTDSMVYVTRMDVTSMHGD